MARRRKMANRSMSRVVPFPSHLPHRARQQSLLESKICSRELRTCLLRLRVDHLDPPTLLPEGVQKLPHGLPQYGMAEVRRDLLEGLEHKAPLVQPWMGHGELA